VHSTGQANLDVLTAGDHYYSPSDLLAGKGMDAFLKDVRSEYDLVVFDLPHTVGLPDVEAVASKLDALLLLYSDSTGPAKSLITSTVRRLIRSGAKMAGIVENSIARDSRVEGSRPRPRRKVAA